MTVGINYKIASWRLAVSLTSAGQSACAGSRREAVMKTVVKFDIE
jgi:hypothetical protein